MRQANKVDEIALILKKMTQLETKLADLEGRTDKSAGRSRRIAERAAAVKGALLECAKEVRCSRGPSSAASTAALPCYTRDGCLREAGGRRMFTKGRKGSATATFET